MPSVKLRIVRKWQVNIKKKGLLNFYLKFIFKKNFINIIKLIQIKDSRQRKPRKKKNYRNGRKKRKSLN